MTIVSITVKNSVHVTRARPNARRRWWWATIHRNVTPASLARTLRLVEGCEGKTGLVATTYTIEN